MERGDDHFPGGAGWRWRQGHRWWMSLLSDSQSQRVSASDQKLRFMSRWLQERAVSKSSSSVTKLPLGAWLAVAATISVSLSFMHLGLHVENEAVGSGGVGLGSRLPPL